MAFPLRFFRMRAGRVLLLGLAGLSLCAPRPAAAEGAASGFARQPSLAPAYSIPVEPLGFTAPPEGYLGLRMSMVSLDFLDENHLLFTFHVPGLLRREAGASEQRQVRAVLLEVPSGAVLAETVWTLHDQARYLWMLGDGHFLLRDRDTLTQFDGSLQSKPLFQFPGPLLWMESDPGGQYLVTDSQEPEHAAAVASAPATLAPSHAPGSSAGSSAPDSGDLVVRILRRDSGKVLLVSRSRSVVHLPINGEGYVANLEGADQQWQLNLSYFLGGSRMLGSVESTCPPIVDFLTQRELLAAVCNAEGGQTLVAMTTEGRRLWQSAATGQDAWPLLVPSPNGARLARETLAVRHAANAYAPFSQDDIEGQLVRIVNAADGTVALTAQASPVLDAGGNVAISPSGRRVAVLNAGALQIFDLPAPPALP
jgi:hypothetical protein